MKNYDARLRFWNKNAPVIEIPDEILLEILETKKIHTYSISPTKECLTIIENNLDHGYRNVYILYSTGHIKEIRKEEYKPKNEQ